MIEDINYPTCIHIIGAIIFKSKLTAKIHYENINM